VRWIRFQAGSQASSTRREETCLSIHPHAKKERKGPGKATRRAQPRRHRQLLARGDPRAPGAVGDSQRAGNLTGKQSFYACVRVVRSTPDIQRIRISQNNCFRGLRSRDPGAAQLLLVSHLHLVTKGHDVVLQLLLNLGNLVSGLVQGCI
jgi:hypothetical protein